MTIRDDDFWLNVAKLTLGYIPILENDIRHYVVSLISLLGNMMVRPTDIRRHDASEKWGIGETAFRENDLAPNCV